MHQLPHANHQQSKIAIVESRITNIDKNIIKVLRLFSIIGQLDESIESIRTHPPANSPRTRPRRQP